MAKNKRAPGSAPAPDSVRPDLLTPDSSAVVNPDPTPIVGDVVAYHPPAVGETLPAIRAKVTFVHDGHDGRLLNALPLDNPKAVEIERTPYREAGPDVITGNTWHWPEEPEATA